MNLQFKPMGWRHLAVWTVVLVVANLGLKHYLAASGTMESIMAMQGTAMDLLVALGAIFSRLLLVLLIPAVWAGYLIYWMTLKIFK